MKAYGVNKQHVVSDELSKSIEEISIQGYTILQGVLSETELVNAREKLDQQNRNQEEEFGREQLEKISELNMVRCPLAQDKFFLDISLNKRVMEIVKKMVGEYVILHLQNGIINMPKKEHHQSSWHRDLPYQDFIISKPLALSALFCIDEFSLATGATFVLPSSHKLDLIPSDEFISKNETPALAPAGSVILFDSMLYHRAGYNSSDKIRRGINNIYVVPILKQQIDLPLMLQGKYSDDEFLANFLGYNSAVPADVKSWYAKRFEKLKATKK